MADQTMLIQAVPLDQFGKTDIVSIFMTCAPLPFQGPPFTQPAIVPVPEPSMLGLAGLGLCLLFLRAWKGKVRAS